jgi:hypothetical protein
VGSASRCQKDCHDSDHYSSQSGSLCGNPLIIRGSYAECGQHLIDLFCLMKMIVTRHSMTIEGLRKSKGVVVEKQHCTQLHPPEY